MSDSAAPKRRAFACSIALFRGEIGIIQAKPSILHPNRTTPHHIDIILYIYTLSCFYFVGAPFTRGRLRCIGLLYCVLAGALEWGRFFY